MQNGLKVEVFHLFEFKVTGYKFKVCMPRVVIGFSALPNFCSSSFFLVHRLFFAAQLYFDLLKK